MIWCDGVERWLNEGMPRHGATAARAHARRCAGCTQAIAGAGALESMLAAAAAARTPAPAGFTDAVMARIDAERDMAPAGARVRVPAAAGAGPGMSRWLVFASEPGAAVALVMVPVLAAIALFLPNVREFLVTSARVAIDSSLAAAAAGAAAASTDASAQFSAMSPTARSLIAVGLVLPLLWSVAVLPSWLAAAMSPRRGPLPRSRT